MKPQPSEFVKMSLFVQIYMAKAISIISLSAPLDLDSWIQCAEAHAVTLPKHLTNN